MAKHWIFKQLYCKYHQPIDTLGGFVDVVGYIWVVVVKWAKPMSRTLTFQRCGYSELKEKKVYWNWEKKVLKNEYSCSS